MGDRGAIRRRGAAWGDAWLVLAVVMLASAVICSSAGALRAQGLEKFFTTPRLADERSATAIATDARGLSADRAIWAALAFEDRNHLDQLLKHGANPNKPEELSLMTPLMAAGTVELAWTLLEGGATVSARDRTGRTALHYAPMMREAVSIIPLLVRAGADVNARADQPDGETPLFCAIENFLEAPDKAPAAEIIRVLVKYGADINATDGKGASVLAIAAAHNRPELIKVLIELGADPAKRLTNGRTPLDYAREANATDVIQLLGGPPGSLSGN